MLQLIDHFGDKDDDHGACSICDRCRGPSIAAETMRKLVTADSKAQDELMKALIPFQSKTSGIFFREMFAPQGWERRRFDGIVWDLESRGFVFQSSQSFTKNGETIEYKRIGLTDEGRRSLHDRGLAPALSVQRLEIDERLVTSRRKSANRKRSFFKKSSKEKR
jgi:hypothetical protein